MSAHDAPAPHGGAELPPAPAPPVVASAPSGLSGALTWTVTGARAVRAPRAAPAPAPAPGFALEVPLPQAAAEAMRQSVHLRGLRGGAVTVPARAKAVLAEDCAHLTLHLPAGALAAVELLRCADVRLELGAAVSAVRVDDCVDVTLVWAGAAAADGPGVDARGGPAGISVFSTGSRKVRLLAARGAGGDAGQGDGQPDAAAAARDVSCLLPETVHTRLPVGADAFSHETVDFRNPWGVG